MAMNTASQSSWWGSAIKSPLFLALISIFSPVALIALGVAVWQGKVAQRAEDRASGKLKAKFEFAGVGNTDEKSLAPLYKKTQLGFQAVYLDDVDRLVHWGPCAKIKNTGDEVIDSIRVEVEFTTGGVIGPGVTQKWPIPYVVTQPSILEPPLSEKLRPQSTVTLALVKPLVEQILKAKLDDNNGQEYFGSFQVRVYCRMAGGIGYDHPDPPNFATLHFAWLPSGFTGEKCKKILEHQPHAAITEQ